MDGADPNHLLHPWDDPSLGLVWIPRAGSPQGVPVFITTLSAEDLLCISGSLGISMKEQ